MCGYGHLDDSLRIVFLRYLDKMTPKGVSRAEVQQGVEECAALIAAQLSCLLNPNSTSYGCKLCSVALLCNALLWASQSMAFRA